MDIITRSLARRTTPEAPRHDRYKVGTIRKCRFYDAIDSNKEGKSTRKIATETKISSSTASRWLQECADLGREAYRKRRKRPKKLRRNPSLEKQQLRDMCDPDKNPVRHQVYKAQIEFYSLRIHPRTLQHLPQKFTNKGQRYRRAYVKKEISKVNKGKRVTYGRTNEDKPIQGHWDRKVFTDKAHIDPNAQGTGFKLREKPPFGNRYDPRNI